MVGEMNSTDISMSAIASISQSWMAILVTILVFIGIFLLIFIISKNFRQLIYGSVISTILIIVYKISSYIGISTSTGDMEPIKWFGYIVAFVCISIIAGRLSQRIPFIKNLEKKIK